MMIKILFLFLLLLILIIICNRHENFVSTYGTVAANPYKQCPTMNMTTCLRYQNCGFITTKNFNNRCVAGDVHGPYDKKLKYHKYYHNDPFTRALIANDNDYRNMKNDVFDIE